MDRSALRELERAVAEFSAGLDGRIYFDSAAAAVYRIEPPGSECIAVACPAPGCRIVTIRPGSPRVDVFNVNCSGCGTVIECHPPAEVVAFGKLGITIAAPRPARPH